MTSENAQTIIDRNNRIIEGSLIYSLHEKNMFSEEQFWSLYDSICTIVNMSLYNDQLTEQISGCYQWILQEMIWHFDPNDESFINGLPKNYMAFIDRLDMAVLAYYRKNPKIMKSAEDFCELQR